MTFVHRVFLWIFCLLLEAGLIADSFPNPDLSNLHFTDEAFDLIQEETGVHSTVIPPPAERRDPKTVSLTGPEEETQTEHSFLQPVRVEKAPLIKAGVPEKQKIRTTAPPPHEHPVPRRPNKEDDDSTQAYGVLENAALSLQDDDQLGDGNITSNCSAPEVHIVYHEKPILKPHELEDGVISDAKTEVLAISLEGGGILKDTDEELPSSHETNTVNYSSSYNPEFLGELGAGTEIQPVLEQPLPPADTSSNFKNDSQEQCNDAVESSVALTLNITEIPTDLDPPKVSTTASEPSDLTDPSSPDNFPPPTAQVTSVLPPPSSTENIEVVAPSPSADVVDLSPLPLENSDNSTDVREPVQIEAVGLQLESPSREVEAEDVGETEVVETTAPPNGTVIQVEASLEVNPNFATESSYEDGEVVTIPESKKVGRPQDPSKRERDWNAFLKSLLPKPIVNLESFVLLAAKFF